MKRIYLALIAIFVMPVTLMAQQSMFNINWDISFPVGETSDYISNTSFRGVSFEGRGFVGDQFSVGGWISWDVFKEKKSNETYNGDGVSVTGTQVRYLNMMPILLTGHYYLGTLDTATPYFGLGLGAIRSLQRTEIGLVAFQNDNWHLGLAPEIGIFIPANYNMGFNLAVKYQYAAKSNDSSYSYVSVILGFSFLDY